MSTDPSLSTAPVSDRVMWALDLDDLPMPEADIHCGLPGEPADECEGAP